MGAQDAEYVRPPFVRITLTERQWDVVREACYSRKTKQAADMGQRIFDQGGTSFVLLVTDEDPMRLAHIDGSDNA